MTEGAATSTSGAASRVRLLWARLGPERRLYLVGAGAAVAAGIVAYGVPLGVQSAIAAAFTATEAGSRAVNGAAAHDAATMSPAPASRWRCLAVRRP